MCIVDGQFVWVWPGEAQRGQRAVDLHLTLLGSGCAVLALLGAAWVSVDPSPTPYLILPLPLSEKWKFYTIKNSELVINTQHNEVT